LKLLTPAFQGERFAVLGAAFEGKCVLRGKWSGWLATAVFRSGVCVQHVWKLVECAGLPEFLSIGSIVDMCDSMGAFKAYQGSNLGLAVVWKMCAVRSHRLVHTMMIDHHSPAPAGAAASHPQGVGMFSHLHFSECAVHTCFW
jgi:hypothetical protein